MWSAVKWVNCTQLARRGLFRLLLLRWLPWECVLYPLATFDDLWIFLVQTFCNPLTFCTAFQVSELLADCYSETSEKNVAVDICGYLWISKWFVSFFLSVDRLSRTSMTHTFSWLARFPHLAAFSLRNTDMLKVQQHNRITLHSGSVAEPLRLALARRRPNQLLTCISDASTWHNPPTSWARTSECNGWFPENKTPVTLRPETSQQNWS